MIFDFAIVGAGIFGLAVARQLANMNRSVILFEAGDIGGTANNASAGLLGALMPASPLVTGPLAAVQLHCLSRYKQHINELGLDVGYRQHGRVQPIQTEAALAGFTQQLAAAADAWRDFPECAHLRIISQAELAERFLTFAPQLAAAPHGYAVDGVSAQVTPRLLLAALAKLIASTVALHPHTRVLRIGDGEIVTADAVYRAKQVIVTAGWQTGALAPAAPIVGVKGQACAVQPLTQDAPLLYTRGGYAVFHDGFTALGSTTEKQWIDTAATATACDAIKTRMADVMPALAAQPLTECWAGVRPKATGALPFIARIDERTIVASGGYKIGLALGFEVAGWLADWCESGNADFWRFVAGEEKLSFADYA